MFWYFLRAQIAERRQQCETEDGNQIAAAPIRTHELTQVLTGLATVPSFPLTLAHLRRAAGAPDKGRVG